jgi:hypothetical protein
MKLTPEQIKLLADKLVDTSKNVYTVAETMFPGAEVDDSTFDDLEKHGDIFKCDLCDTWLGCCLKDESIPEMCEICAGSM